MRKLPLLSQVAINHLQRLKIPAARHVIAGLLLMFIPPLFALWLLSFQLYSIPSASMLPTLFVGDHIVARASRARCEAYLPGKVCRVFAKEPQRGDIIVFKVKRQNEETYVVKRVAGLPGEQVTIKNGLLIIDNVAVKKAPLPAFTYHRADGKNLTISQFRETVGEAAYNTLYGYRPEPPLPAPDLETMPTVIVPDDHYFVLGDDRDRSFDSRMSLLDGGVGMVAGKTIAGIAAFVLLSREPANPLKLSSQERKLRWERIFLSLEPTEH